MSIATNYSFLLEDDNGESDYEMAYNAWIKSCLEFDLGLVDRSCDLMSEFWEIWSPSSWMWWGRTGKYETWSNKLNGETFKNHSNEIKNILNW